jgi:hypothetical protein
VHRAGGAGVLTGTDLGNWPASAHATILCRKIFSFKNKALKATQDASSQFCPQKMCRKLAVRIAGTVRSRAKGNAAPARKNGMVFNSHRIKDLS